MRLECEKMTVWMLIDISENIAKVVDDLLHFVHAYYTISAQHLRH